MAIQLIQTEQDRYYEHSDFGRLPSVSEILDMTQDKAELNRLRRWEHKMIKVHGEDYPSQVRQDALVRGTSVHKLIENYWMGNFPDSSNEYYDFFDSVKPFLDFFSYDENRLLFEKSIGDYSYAGTVDFVGVFHNTTTVFDFTTSYKIKMRQWVERKFIQCAAYANLLPIEKIYPSQLGVVVITPKTYQLFLADSKEYLPKWFSRLIRYKDMVS